VRAITELVKSIHSTTLVAVDGVCSVAAEELRMEAWNVDVTLTARQKALGAPPGLSIVVAGPHALRVFASRKMPVANYFANWARWIPIMKAYEERRASYFGTPPVQLILALNVSLKQILGYGMEAIFKQHRAIDARVKSTLRGWGLRMVAYEEGGVAHTLSAVYLPDGVTAAQLLSHLLQHGIVCAGGLHREIGSTYFRVGHMGVVTAMEDATRGYIDRTVNALRASLVACGVAI